MTASRAGSKRKPEVLSGDWHLRSLALAAGAITGIIGTAFKFGIASGYSLYVRLITLGNRGSFRGWLLAALSGAAMVAAAAFLTQRFAPEAAGSGIQEIEGTLAGVRPRLRWVEVILVKFFGGLLAMSSGLVLGREGPTVAIGACVGAALARFRPDTKDRNEANTLVSSGSAAGLAVAFNAPVGGILFVLEETRREFPVDLRSAQCVILATVAAIIVSLLISGTCGSCRFRSINRPRSSNWFLCCPSQCSRVRMGLSERGAIKDSEAGSRAEASDRLADGCVHHRRCHWHIGLVLR